VRNIQLHLLIFHLFFHIHQSKQAPVLRLHESFLLEMEYGDACHQHLIREIQCFRLYRNQTARQVPFWTIFVSSALQDVHICDAIITSSLSCQLRSFAGVCDNIQGSSYRFPVSVANATSLYTFV